MVGNDAAIAAGDGDSDRDIVVNARGGMDRRRTIAVGDAAAAAGFKRLGSSSSLEDEIDSTSSRDMNFSTAEVESIDNRHNTGYGNRATTAADEQVVSSDNSDDDEDRTPPPPQYRHSVTTNWSSSDEEADNYRDRSSLFQRRSETSSPDYFYTRESSARRGE